MRKKSLGLGLTLVGALVGTLTLIQPARTAGPYKIAVIPAIQPQAPMKVVSTSASGLKDFVAGAEVKNVSDRVIVRYSLVWVAQSAVPARVGFQPGDQTYIVGEGKPIQTKLEPGVMEDAPAQGVLPDDFENALRLKGSTERVFIFVGVTKVTFSDGSTWTADPKDFPKKFRVM